MRLSSNLGRSSSSSPIDNGGVFRTKQLLAICEVLEIQKEYIHPRQSWENLVETHFNVMRRMSQVHFDQVTSWQGAKIAHERFVTDYNAQPRLRAEPPRRQPPQCYWKDSFATLARESFQKKTAKLSFQKQRLPWRLHSQFSHHLPPSHSYLELHERGRLSQQFCHLSASRIAPLSKQSKHSLTYLLIQAPDSFVSHLRFVVEIAL